MTAGPMTDLAAFGWAAGPFPHLCAQCFKPNFASKGSWLCQKCAEQAMERHQAMMCDQDRNDDTNADHPETAKPIGFAELARRGMDDRLTAVIHAMIGDHLPKSDLTSEEMHALGYGKPCPCGEKGMKPDEKLCGCGEHCDECCKSGQCGCGDSCACKV